MHLNEKKLSEVEKKIKNAKARNETQRQSVGGQRETCATLPIHDNVVLPRERLDNNA